MSNHYKFLNFKKLLEGEKTFESCMPSQRERKLCLPGFVKKS